MAMLTKIEIKGYRSIKAASLELDRLNVMIGANGAGKSNFVSFFKLLNEMMGSRLQNYIAGAGRAQSLLHFGPKRTPQMEATMEFRSEDFVNIYHQRLFHVAGDTLAFADETLQYHHDRFPKPKVISLGAGHQETRIGEEAIKTTKESQTARAFRHLLVRCRVYHFHDTSPTARIRQSCYLRDHHCLMPDAGNLGAMLYAYYAGSKYAL